jgi:hypothetical protein
MDPSIAAELGMMPWLGRIGACLLLALPIGGLGSGHDPE